MSTQAGELVVRIVAQDGGTLRRDVEQQVNGAAQGAVSSSKRSMSQIGASARDMGTKMSLAATLPLAAVAKSATDAASATVEAQNKVNVVFGENADAIHRFAESSAEAFGISRREALGAAGTFGNLFRAMGIGTGQAAKTSTAMTGLAGDLASFNDADPSEVLEALRAGLIGEAEPMRRFGVQLSEARVQAEALAMGLVKPVKNAAEVTKANLAVEDSVAALAKAQTEHGKGSREAQGAAADLALAQEKLAKVAKGSTPDLTDRQKLLAREAIIMKDTALAQGDFQRSLSDSAANQERVSKALADDAQAAVGEQLLPLYQKAVIGLGKLAKAFGELSPEAQRNVLVIGGLVAAAGPLLAIFGNLVRLGTGTAKAIGGVAKGASATVGAAKRMAQGYRDAQAAQSAFSGTAGTIGGKVKSAQTALVNGARAAGTWAAGVVRAGAQAAAAMARAAAQQIASLARITAAYVAAGARMVATMVATAARTAAAWAMMAARSLAAAARMALSWLIAMGPMALLIAGVVALVALIIKNWDRIKAATQAAFRAVGAAIASAWGRIKAVVSGAISAVVGFVSRGVAQWVAAFQRARALLTAAVSAIRSAVVSGFQRVVSAVVSAVGKVVNTVQGIKDKVVGAVKGAASWLLQAGKDVVQGLINGIGDMAGEAVQRVKDLAGDVIDAAKGAWKIFSPSRVFAELGGFLVKGLVKGLTGTAEEAVAASKDLADRVTEAYDERAKARAAKSAKAVAAAREKMSEAEREAYDKANKGKGDGAQLTKAERKQRDALLQLIKEHRSGQVRMAKRRQQLLADLGTAREDLANLQEQAKQYARDVQKSLVDGANITSAMPEGVAVTAQSLTDRLRKQVEDAKQWGADLAKLGSGPGGLGLNQTMIDQIVAAGVEGGAQVAQELAAATPQEIAELNRLTAELTAQGGAIGARASEELHGAGIAAAQQLVGQLEKDEARLGAVMERQAQKFANKVREGLGLALHDFTDKQPGLYTQVPPKDGEAGAGRGGGKGGKGSGNKPGQGGGPARVGTGGKGNLEQGHGGAKDGRPINVTVNNPVPEKASESVPKRLRRLQQTGALR